VPCFWAQLPDLRYKPKVTVLPSNNHVKKNVVIFSLEYLFGFYLDDCISTTF
jgi:hypothetical protein